MADQGVSSLSNIVVAVIVARSVSAAEFGAFGVAMVVYQLGLGLTRAAVTLNRTLGDPTRAATSSKRR